MSKDFLQPTEHAKINQFGIRCFRDTADMDYIAARLAMRHHLTGPFLWSALHSVEKYLKCILFLHRCSTKNISHALKKALDRMNDELTFKIVFDEGEQELLDHLIQWGGERYLLTSFMVDSIELIQLDSLVWKLRQYCVPLNKRHYAEEPSDTVLFQRLAEVSAVLAGSNRVAGHLQGAVLEKILADRKHPSHDALTWQNAYYARSERRSIRYRTWRYAVNAPLFLHPELANTVEQWMQIPPAVLQAANMLDRQRKTSSKKTKKG